MAPVLSSNWKKLQSTLKQEKTTTKKKEVTERQQNTIAKRKRLEGKAQILGKSLASSTLEPSKRRKMGGAMSTSAAAAESLEQDDKAPSASLALWAEDNDISPADLAAAYGTSPKSTALPSANSQELINVGLSPEVDIGKFIAIDCEMVGVGPPDSTSSVLARVSLVNFHGTQIYDSFVRPKEFVTDWRTHVSGISPSSMTNARTFEQVQSDVASLIKDRILIGHAIRNDLDVLMLGHPKRDIRDTSKFKGFRKFSAGRSPALKKLAKEILGVDIQGGQHSSVEDARATMLLFRRFKGEFEVEHAQKFPQKVVGEGISKGGKKKKKVKK